MQGELYLARSTRRRIEPAPLPGDLQAALDDANAYTRLGAVAELRSRLLSANLPVAAGARAALARVAEADTRLVAESATEALRQLQLSVAPAELSFGPLPPGTPSDPQRLDTSGPPLARAATATSSQDWIRVSAGGRRLRGGGVRARAGTFRRGRQPHGRRRHGRRPGHRGGRSPGHAPGPARTPAAPRRPSPRQVAVSLRRRLLRHSPSSRTAELRRWHHPRRGETAGRRGRARQGRQWSRSPLWSRSRPSSRSRRSGPSVPREPAAGRGVRGPARVPLGWLPCQSACRRLSEASRSPLQQTAYGLGIGSAVPAPPAVPRRGRSAPAVLRRAPLFGPWAARGRRLAATLAGRPLPRSGRVRGWTRERSEFLLVLAGSCCASSLG